MRKIAVCIGIVGASLVLAATIVVGAKGTGGAVDSVGTRYGFALDVAKATDGEHTRVEGYFRVRREFRDGEHNYLVEIGMSPDELGKIENVVSFAGPGRRRISRDGHLIKEDHGRMVVKVTDRHKLEPPSGEPDLLNFKYVLPNGVPAVQFNGKVYWGDIAVFRREMP